MASISRIVLKDCNLHAVQARHHPGPSSRRVLSHLDAREGVSLPSNARISTATNRLWSPVVALAAPSPRSAKVLCNAAANASGDVPSRGGRTTYETIIETLTTLFPLWVILGTILGIYKPAAVTWLETDLFTLGLGFLMLSMGLTLTFDDFRRCLRNPWTVGVGFLAQYLIKPLLGFVIAMELIRGIG